MGRYISPITQAGHRKGEPNPKAVTDYMAGRK